MKITDNNESKKKQKTSQTKLWQKMTKNDAGYQKKQLSNL